MSDLLALAAVGAASGVIAGLAGFAGGIVIVPALTWLYGPHALHTAIVVSWFSVSINSFGAVIGQLKVRTSQERLALLRSVRWYLGGAVLVTPLIAAYASGHRSVVSSQAVAVLQLFLGATMLWPMSEADRTVRQNRARDASFGGAIGGVSTLIGVGGGVYTIAYFVYGAGSRFRDAIATANLAGFAIGTLSVLGYCAGLVFFGTKNVLQADGPVSAAGMVTVVAAGLAAAPLGVMLSRRVPVKRLKQVMIGLLMISATRLLLTSL